MSRRFLFSIGIAVTFLLAMTVNPEIRFSYSLFGFNTVVAQDDDPFGDFTDDGSSDGDLDDDLFDDSSDGDTMDDDQTTDFADSESDIEEESDEEDFNGKSKGNLLSEPDNSAPVQGDSTTVFGRSDSRSPFEVQVGTSGNSAQTFKNEAGEDIPIIDQEGKVLFKRSEDKLPSEMTERDFYKTLTPTEKAILDKAPATGPELFEAATLIAKVGRPEFAKILFEQSLSAAQGTPEEYAVMLDRLGSERLYALIADPILGSAAQEAAAHVQQQANLYWETPEIIQSAFQTLKNGTETEKTAALVNLRKGGNASISTLLNMLDTENPDDIQLIVRIFDFLGPDAMDATLASLVTENADRRLALISVLQELRTEEICFALAALYYNPQRTGDACHQRLEEIFAAQPGKLPNKEAVIQYYYNKSLEHFQNTAPLVPVIDGMYSFWRENRETGLAEHVTLPEVEARRYLAAFYARLAVQTVAPDEKLTHTDLVSLDIVCTAEKIIYETGLDRPLNIQAFLSLCPEVSVPELDAALDYAMKSNHPKGGIIPVTILGQMGTESLCYRPNQASTLVQAAQSSDRRLRFAALQTIVRLNPSESYIGSSYVISSLIQFTNSTGSDKIIVAVPKISETMTVGAFIAPESAVILPAVNGNEILRQAQEDCDVEFVLADSRIRQPDLRTVAQALRDDFRTKDIPMLICYDDELQHSLAVRYGGLEPNTLIAPMPCDKESGNWAVRSLFEKTAPEQVPADLRLKQAKAAVQMLTHLLSTRPALYSVDDLDLLIKRLLAKPEFLSETLALSTIVASPVVQNLLIDLIGDIRFSTEIRRRALAAFEQNLNKNGSLLRGPDIIRMYDRYNASETEDRETQNILSSLLDVYENVQKSAQ